MVVVVTGQGAPFSPCHLARHPPGLQQVMVTVGRMPPDQRPARLLFPHGHDMD